MEPLEKVCQRIMDVFPAYPDFISAFIVCIVLKGHLLLDYHHHYGALVDRYVQLFCARVFGYQNSLIITCTPDMTWTQLTRVMVQQELESTSSGNTSPGTGNIPNVLVLNSLDRASRSLQVLILDLIRSKSLEHEGHEYTLPEPFLIIGTISGARGALKEHVDVGATEDTCQISSSHGKLLKHLREHFLLIHELDETTDLRLHGYEPESEGTVPLVEQSYFGEIRSRIPDVRIIADMQRYMQDIVVFLRCHRLIRSGVSPNAVKDFWVLVKALCVLHGYTYATPTIAAMAARIKFPLSLSMCSPSDEPTIAYGGDINLITAWMKKWDVDLVVDDVLRRVPPPL